MGEMIVALAGTPEGESLALVLAMVSAVAHAIFGAICKGGKDPYLNRGAINISYSLMAAPFALLVFPLPSTAVFIVLFVSYLIHLSYEWFQAAAFSRGEFTLVYPVARGTGPAITGLLAIFVFSEHLEASQWFGLLLLSSAIVSLAIVNLSNSTKSGTAGNGLRLAVILAFCTGINTAIYTIVDAYGVRLAINPFSFIAWMFFLGGFGFPFVAFARWRGLEVKPAIAPLLVRGVIGGAIGILSFGALMLATRVGKVTEAAALRETSIIFATIIGVVLFKEALDKRRLMIIGLIALGAVLVEFH